MDVVELHRRCRMGDVAERDRDEPVGRRMMATKPYAAGGNYIDTMSDYCGTCRYDRKRRVGDGACPFTTLYWDFLAGHHERLVKNPRISRQVRTSEQLSDLLAVRERAVEVRRRLDDGTL